MSTCAEVGALGATEATVAMIESIHISNPSDHSASRISNLKVLKNNIKCVLLTKIS